MTEQAADIQGLMTEQLFEYARSAMMIRKRRRPIDPVGEPLVECGLPVFHGMPGLFNHMRHELPCLIPYPSSFIPQPSSVNLQPSSRHAA